MSSMHVNNAGGLWGGKLILFDSLPSTNQWIMDNDSQCRHGDVVRAVRQTAGRGRFQRSWHSPDDRALAISVAVHVGELRPATAQFLQQLAAVAVFRMLRRHNVNASLKWPNDVMAAGRKISGILAEQNGQSRIVALGIGVNVNTTADDLARMDINHPAASMAMLLERPVDIETVSSQLLQELAAVVELVETRSPSAAIEIWKQNDYLADAAIRVRTPTVTLSGRYGGLDPEGQLILIDSSNLEHRFWSGDVFLAVLGQPAG